MSDEVGCRVWWRSLLRVLTGVVFFLSAVGKLVGIDEFELYVYSYGWLPLSASYMAARVCIGVELALSVLLCAGWYERLTRTATLLLLLFFTVVLCYAVLVGRDDSCQCFGQMVDMDPGESLLKNGVLIVMVLLAKPQGARPHRGWERVLSVAALVVALAVPFAVSVPDNWGFGPQREPYGAEALKEAVGEGGALAAMGVGEGRRMVAFVTPNCPYCKLAREKLGSLAKRHGIAEEKIVYVEPSDIGDSLFIAITYGARPLMMLMEGEEVRTTYHLRNVDESEVEEFLGKL